MMTEELKALTDIAAQPAAEPAQGQAAGEGVPRSRLQQSETELISVSYVYRNLRRDICEWLIGENVGDDIKDSEIIEVIKERNAELTATRQQLEAARAEVARLREALKPFAEAYKEIPDGLRSTLRIWNPDDPSGITGLSATTDHLAQAAALAAGSEGAE